jgi:hypothetical protein
MQPESSHDILCPNTNSSAAASDEWVKNHLVESGLVGLTMSGLVVLAFIVFRAENQVVRKDIGREGDNSNPKTREEISEHYA